MLEIRPNCEHCNKKLAPSSTEAMICSFECTFCKSCVDDLLDNVCPNCGGGFCNRPIRPSQNYKNEHFLGKYPASPVSKQRIVDQAEHQLFAQYIKDIKPQDR